jgi:hypothetical protein
MKSPTLMIGARLNPIYKCCKNTTINWLTTGATGVIIILLYNERHQMAGKAKSIYLTITLKGQFKTVFNRVFFDAKAYNEYVKSDEFKAKWPAQEFDIIKEVY